VLGWYAARPWQPPTDRNAPFGEGLAYYPETMDKQDISVSILAANIYGTIAGLLPTLLIVTFFSLRWLGRTVPRDRLHFTGTGGFLLFLAVLVVGIAVHEGLHALGWILFARQPWKTIEFGFKQLTPYAHARRPMPVTGYRLAIFLPGLLLGIVPGLVAIATGSTFLLATGLLFTFTAGGDFLVLWLLRRVPRSARVQDHPERVGCYVYHL